ncbi:hypothetical protein [Deinococcus cellulosilyticus]|uniref:Uncharacterized protein n=1 Tax=Deinococcus cellulosilyticus (strain DSM 18568 / NBRC 106333 / KACC 11606 / 5516J-15) TaxID=1223518 RepID=A0A511N7Q3_DEIC1|nr:hypothetical protein [Deinococcus cellulosilyticus]GEM48518.1 hypothetical protein DC3_41530 [Deinococcus cellulosilyticus NBRC 106333 = KACC 11606]
MEDFMLPTAKGRLFCATYTPEMDVRFYITQESKVLLETDEESTFETIEDALEALRDLVSPQAYRMVMLDIRKRRMLA